MYGYKVYGLGLKSCGDYLNARKNSDDGPYQVWLARYLTSASYWVSQIKRKKIDYLATTVARSTDKRNWFRTLPLRQCL